MINVYAKVGIHLEIEALRVWLRLQRFQLPITESPLNREILTVPPEAFMPGYIPGRVIVYASGMLGRDSHTTIRRQLQSTVQTFMDAIADEKKGALRAISMIKEKRCGRIKGRTVGDGSTQRQLYTKEEMLSPTVSTDALILSLMIDAKERRDVATADVMGHKHIDSLKETMPTPSQERVGEAINLAKVRQCHHGQKTDRNVVGPQKVLGPDIVKNTSKRTKSQALTFRI